MPVDVAVTEFRAHLSDWLSRASEGDEVVITERGIPVARLLAVQAGPRLEGLIAAGVIGAPRSTRRPTAVGRARPRARRPVADAVSEQRR